MALQISRAASAGLAAGRQAPLEPSWPEWCFAVYGILLYVDAFFGALRVYLNDAALPGQSDPTSTASQSMLLAGLLACLWYRRDRVRPVLRDALPIILVAALCIGSVLWAQYPFASIRRSVNFGSCVFFGIYIYAVFGFPRIIRLVAYITLLAALCSLLFYAALPSIGIETDIAVSAMRGVFPQKNNCADAMLVGMPCWTYIGMTEPQRRVRSVAAMLLLFACIVLARSMTATLVALVVFIATALMLPNRQPALRLFVGFLGVFAVAATITLLLANPDEFFAILGRDPTLTGRVPLWHMVLQAIAARPLLGYGYGSFWNPDSVTVQYIWLSLDWDAPTAHCGYLEILLQLGIAGLALYVWIWGIVIRTLAKAARVDPSPETAWLILFMLVTFVLNFDEGPLPWPDIFGALTPLCLIFLRQWSRRSDTEMLRWRPRRNSRGFRHGNIHVVRR